MDCECLLCGDLDEFKKKHTRKNGYLNTKLKK